MKLLGFTTASSMRIARKAAEHISRTHPDLVLVGMGNPRQERWIARHVPEVSPFAMAIGAWFDFYSQTMPRAPQWVRSMRAEWVYRLWREPRRLAGRYLVGNGVFLTRLAGRWLAQHTPLEQGSGHGRRP